MQAYEKLGAFYLGREVDPDATDETRPGYLLYDSKDLTTHAVCVGMTGSGKTGLCISLLEEAALDGVPAIAIDPKGDLGNLLLTFPDLAAESFEPWVNADDAESKGLSVAELAAQQAELWRTGLAKWDQSAARIAKLRETVDMAIYTPGSEAGLPISILGSLAAPPAAVIDDGDLFRDRVSTTVTSILTLLGIGADPIKSREHILLSSILDRSWRAGQDLDLGGLIGAIQTPPMERIGVVDIETFYPQDERFELAMQVNSLLAAPGFQSWLVGDPLDAGRLLFTPEGRPRLSIVSIAHLSESERMFFVTLLLNEVLSWVRTRPGTSSLRAILYMDEIFGFMPPVAEPPSKRPLLTLLKQARAYGLGVVLATQNPVDLDYKGLSNTGTWFLGRLQTERDKLRVLDGLEGVGAGFDRSETERLLSGLGKRIFLLHNVHESGPVLFRTRWAMSYLRGPLTRGQIRELSEGSRPSGAESGASTPDTAMPPATTTAARPAGTATDARPLVPPDVPEVFLPVDRYATDLAYLPGVLGLATVHFTNRSRTREASVDKALALVPFGDRSGISWHDAVPVDVDRGRLLDEPAGPASYAPFDQGAPTETTLRAYEKALDEHLYRNSTFTLFESELLDELSRPGETEGDFRIRLGELARQERDRKIDELRQRYAKRLQTIEDRVGRAQNKVEVEREQASSKKLDNVISMGTTILSAFLGRKRLSSTTLSKAGSAVRGFGRSSKEAEDVRRAEEALDTLEGRLADLEAELEAEIDAMEERYDPMREELGTVDLKPRRTDLELKLVALAWIPVEAAGEGPASWLTRTAS